MKWPGCTLVCGGRALEEIPRLQSTPSPREVRGHSPALGLPSPEFQCWEEDSSQNLTVRIKGVSNHPGETEGCYKPRYPIKGPIHRLAHLQAVTMGSSRGTAAQEVPETHRERLSYMASGRGLEGQPSLSLC